MLKMIEVLAKKDKNLDIVIKEKVVKYMDERKEKEKRECNLIFHNIAEAESEDIEDFL